MIKAGIIDPAKSIWAALQDTTSHGEVGEQADNPARGVL